MSIAMTRRTTLASLLALSAAPLALSALAQAPRAPAAPGPDDERLNAFLEEAWQRDLTRDPQLRTQLEMPGPHDRWTVVDEAFREETQAISKANLERLKGFDLSRLSPAARVSHRLFENQMAERIRLHPWRFHECGVSHLYGPHTGIPSFLIGFHAIESLADAKDYVARLERIPEVMDAASTYLTEQANRGILLPAFSYNRLLISAKAVLEGAPFQAGKPDTALLANLKEKLAAVDAPAAEKDALATAGTKALAERMAPAYQRFITVVEGLSARQKESRGAWSLPDGAAYYQAMILNHTSLPLAPEAIHALGLKETARLHEELRQVLPKLGFKGTVQEFFTHLRTDKSFRFPDTEEGRKEYLATATGYIDAMRARLDELFGTKPKAPVVVKPVEAFREKATPSAFYEQSSPDGSRPGVFYANLSDMSVQTRHDLEALCYHEAIPGHHMQVAIAQEMTGLPTFRRFSFDTAYGEGWAMYTERLAKEHGFYKEPISEAGRICSELFRAGRLVVDSGIHAKQWTREQAIQWMNDNTANSLADNENEIERYFVWPGQATAYKVGMNRILELREQAKAKLGPRFDLRGFHDAVLTNGSVTLPILEEVVGQWVESRRGA
ncbi:DUF885 domain-containing protein [Aerophototrophica crusticola]|uniref:DUF885 domain-containing protein n=1 Tax=Aerophototrophica crusticola TaxID=1709002 RepID=A0A858R553_9PROT|nr:DUF885 domain-containing protein [Rhodospirillaceae bacterium B3]